MAASRVASHVMLGLGGPHHTTKEVVLAAASKVVTGFVFWAMLKLAEQPRRIRTAGIMRILEISVFILLVLGALKRRFFTQVFWNRKWFITNPRV